MPSASKSNYRQRGKRLTVRSIETIAALTAVLLTITVASRASADEVTRWNQIATDASAVANTNPLAESCVFAIVHVAIHDAVNAVEPRYEPYQPGMSPAPAGASVEAAIAGAAHDTLVALLPDSKVSFDAALEETLRTVTDDSRKAAGLEVGRAAAAAILAARKNDGQNRTVEYAPGTKPGDYRPTPPDFKPAALAHWGSVTPFVLKSSAQFRCPEPPAVDSPLALAEIEEVKAIGGSKSVTRTPEQSEIGRYWYENSPQGWNRIAREVLATRQFDVWENARLFALVNLAMADGYIAGFEDKYYYNYWRPVTVIGTWRQRMAELSSDPACAGLSFEPYGGRGCCGYGDGPVLQHRLHQFFDDERRTLPGHHPQVLEPLGSSARKWCIPCPVRHSLLDRGERRLHPRRAHWRVGFRALIAARQPSTGEHRFPRAGKSRTLKLRNIMDILARIPSSARSRTVFGSARVRKRSSSK